MKEDTIGSTHRLICVVILVGVVACAQGPSAGNRGSPELSDPTPHYMLYSWKVGQGYHFALIKEADWPSFVEHFQPKAPSIPDLPTLELALSKLPKPVLVIWSGLQVAGLIYPPEAVTNQVKHFAAQQGIHLQIAPLTEDPAG